MDFLDGIYSRAFLILPLDTVRRFWRKSWITSVKSEVGFPQWARVFDECGEPQRKRAKLLFSIRRQMLYPTELRAQPCLLCPIRHEGQAR
jgi:hypothetical protein